MKTRMKVTKRPDAVALAALLEGKKPGQYVFIGPNGSVLRVVTLCGKSKTDQSFKDDTDVNFQLERAHARGLLRHAKQYEGEYDDFPDFDFQDAQFQMARAKTMFEDLPSATRVRFGNDPGAFMEFVNNPENIPELQKTGLLKGIDGKRADGSPVVVPPVDPPPVDPPLAVPAIPDSPIAAPAPAPVKTS